MSLRIEGDQLASLGTVTEATIGHKETGDRTVGRCHVTLARRDTQACTSWRRAMIGVRKWMRIIHPMYVWYLFIHAARLDVLGIHSQ